MRLLALVTILAALAPAAAGASTGGAWTSHRSAAGGFAISTPSTWIDMTRLTPTVLAKVRATPALAQYVSLLRTSKAIKLLVADASITSLEDHYSTNLNVVQASTVGDLQLQRDASVATLRSSGVVKGAIRSRYVTLPGGKSAAISYLARFSATTPEVAIEQFIFVRAGKVTVLTYTTLPKLRSVYAATFARSAHTFRFV